MASIWMVSGLLLFAAGWLLGRHQSAPTVNASQLAAVLDHSVQLSTSQSVQKTSAPSSRNPQPWRTEGTTATSPTPASSAASTPPSPAAAGAVATDSSTGPDSSTDSVSPAAPDRTAADPPGDSGDPGDPGDPGAQAPSAQGADATSPPAPATDSVGSSQSDAYSLQIGAFASQENAQVQIDKVLKLGLSPYVVPVINGERTLYTVRLGRYPSREAAQDAAADLRSTKDIPAVIRSLDADS